MSEALAMGIQPGEFKDMEAWELEGLTLIERLRGRKAKQNQNLDSFYAKHGVSRWA